MTKTLDELTTALDAAIQDQVPSLLLTLQRDFGMSNHPGEP